VTIVPIAYASRRLLSDKTLRVRAREGAEEEEICGVFSAKDEETN